MAKKKIGCVCVRDCQAEVRRVDDKPKYRFFSKGQVGYFEECPEHFRKLDAGSIDFLTASEEELQEADFNLEKLKKFILDTFDRKAGTRGKEKTIEMLLDCRYRSTEANI